MRSLFIILLSSSATLIVILLVNDIFIRSKNTNAQSIYTTYKMIIDTILIPVPLIISVWILLKSSNITTTLFVAGDELFENSAQIQQMITLYVWIFGIAFLSIGHTIYYHRWHKKLKLGLVDAGAYEYRLMDKVKCKLNFEPKIRICYSVLVRSPISIGIKNHIIVLPRSQICNDPKALSLIFEHEIYHFASKDLSHKLLFLCVKILFWFNPLVYICFNRINFWCELATDEKVIRNITEEERKLYAITILSFIPDYEGAHIHNQTTITLAFFNNNKNDLIRRISFIMKKRGFRKKYIVSVLAIILTFFVSGSFSVYAANYNNEVADIDRTITNTPPDALDIVDISRMFAHTSAVDEQYLELLQPIAGHDYYILKDGQQFPWNQTMGKERWLCSHNKVDVSTSDHIKKGEGCLTIYYEAKQCTKCGIVWRGKELGRLTIESCSH